MNRIACILLLFALNAVAGSISLFDGKTLDGWEGDPKWWRVEDGALTGGSQTEKIPRNFFLATTKSFHNFDLRLKLKLTGDPKTGMINSGVQIRSVRVPNDTEMKGYQVDVGDGWWGKLYDESRRNKVIAQAADLAAVNSAIKKDDWNEFRIRTDGTRIQSWINGVQSVDYTEATPGIPQDGRIAIQIHGGGIARVQVKDVTIEELPAAPSAPTWNSSATKETKTPDEERALLKVPEGFEVQLVASEDIPGGIGKFVPLAFDQHGALWTTTALEYPVDGNENPAAADAIYTRKAKDKVLVYDRDPNSPTGYSSKPRVFADGLAIPLGVLPFRNGCYVQHGHDIAFLEDTDSDGKADKRTVVLTGFGVQDSHLFPHQFMRAPGGWIWMAQGAFNYSKVRRPNEPAEKAVQFDQTRMARFRPDGSQFTITSNGPCNIWGLVLNGEGESFIQEANDFGYPVMPFHEYANYPGCSNRVWKSYAPEFPGAAPDFRMGGTGLSGLALTDKNGPFPEAWRDVMLVANPITNRIQGIKMHRDGPYWKLDKPTDFLISDDPWFRPVAIFIGPDGCLYIIDWYNKIISHNEVARNHPDRDKTRGRIWRVKPTGAQPFEVPDFTKLDGSDLIAKLTGDSLTQSHLAWQTIADRKDPTLTPALERLIQREWLLTDRARGPHPASAPTNARIAALWALSETGSVTPKILQPLLQDENRNVRREALHVLQWQIGNASHEGWSSGKWETDLLPLLRPMLGDADPEVRAEVCRTFSGMLAALSPDGFPVNPWPCDEVLTLLLSFARQSLAEPMGKSTQNGKPIKVREAYDREFERYLVRMSLEQHRTALARFIDSNSAEQLPVEARLLASLALEPKASATRVSKLLPALHRAPGQEELLRLAQFPDEAGIGNALRAILADGKNNAATLQSLLTVKTQIDAAKLAPFITDAANSMLSATDAGTRELGIRLASGFSLHGTEAALVSLAQSNTQAAPALKALSELGSDQIALFTKLAESSPDPGIREEALLALANSQAPTAHAHTLSLYPKLSPSLQKNALQRLCSTKLGASAVVVALTAGTIPKTALDASTLDRLQAVLGADDPGLLKLVDSLGTLFRPVLVLDGSDNAWTQTEVRLDGPCTIEAWVRLDPQQRKIGNSDGIFGSPGQLDLNFFGGIPRVYTFAPRNDVAVAKKPLMPHLWTHVAFTRDAAGLWKIYQDGELDATGTVTAQGAIDHGRIAWTTASGGTQGSLCEVRIWNRERTADEIRAACDRTLPASTTGLLFTSASGSWGNRQSGAKVAKTNDFPPILTAEEAAALDTKYAKFRALASQPGNIESGKLTSNLCQACHLMGSTGGNIGPNLSGVGAMGTEAILRNILQPNAAMENGYRIFRVELKSGDIIDALFVSEDKDAVIIRMPGTEDRRIPRGDIREAKYLRRSLMPEGLLDGLTPQQVTDLFTFLRTLQ